MRRTPLIIASLLLTGACSSPQNDPLRPSMSQLRYGDIVIPDDEMPIIPEAQHILGVVVNSEDQEGYNDAPALKLTDHQLTLFKDLDDPLPLEKHREKSYSVVGGDLYDDIEGEGALNYDDVQQGAIADCYLAAALSSAFYSDTDRLIRDGLIRKNTDKDGEAVSFSVRFYDAWGSPQDIEVDADLVRSAGGNATYIRSMDSTRGNEEWGISLIEKAYAQWHGGFEEIGNGGNAGDVLQAVSGTNSSYRRLKYLSDYSLFRSVTQAHEQGKATVACTFGEDDGVDYSGTSIYAWHCYSLLGVRKETVDEKEVVTVKLRNPWGRVEPAGNGANDGIFELDTDTFRRLYQGLSIGGGTQVDVRAPSAVEDLTFVETYDGHMVFGFSASGDDANTGLATSYDVRVSTNYIDADSFYRAERVQIASPQAPGSAERFEISGLQNDTTYYVAVRVEDESGHVSSLSNIATGKPEGFVPPSAEQAGLFFDFEGDLSEWSFDGLFHHTARWSVSPTHSMWFGSEDTGNYDTGSRASGSLASPFIDLTGYTHPILQWEQRLSVEPGQTNDKAWVEILWDGDPKVVWSKAESAADGVMETVSVDMSDFKDEMLFVYWNFDSVDEVDNTFEGWFIDNVRIIDAP